MRESKETLLNEGRKRSGGVPWLRASFFLLVLFAVVVPFTDVPLKLKDYAKELILAKREADRMAYVPEEPVVKEVIYVEEEPQEAGPEAEELRQEEEVDSVVEEGDPIMLDKAYVPKEHFVGTKGDMVRMSKGFYFDYAFETQKGGLASEERKQKESYVAEYRLKVKMPQASTSMNELEGVNGKLGHILPGLESLLDGAKVSDFYYTLYENKVKRLEREVLKLNELSTKHNFYDCETILNLTHEETGRKMLFLQGDMDVVSDGSDGDRLAEMPDKIVNSTYYQPFTSYGWKKTTKTPNPMLAGWKKRIGNAKREIADKKTSADRRAWLKSRLKMLERGVEDMKSRSYLIAEYDPFIVMPVNVITNRSDAHAARVGDYAVVIFEDKVYPAIVGDGGPTFKVGEGSLRLAKEINERASSYSRPVSDVTVSYLVFSNSRDTPASAPDYAKWHARCSELLEEIGGLGDGYALHEWEDLLASKDVEQSSEEGQGDAAKETEEEQSSDEGETSSNS
ncbi:glycoside hydrolase family 75 protein [Rubritalea tangerina]|uniref:Glycoside hydrolase family 75 protein n=2 Tax=Rubritalea tangerina TaxID=430798 RepID=A0ABW4ZGQ8_9BACT